MSANIMQIAIDENGTMEMKSTINDRGGVATRDGYTMFGFWENGVLRCAHGKRSKTYKNPQRAVAKWIRE